MRNIVPLLLIFLLMSCHTQNSHKDRSGLKNKLEGVWEASAFSGKLHEKWILNPNGWMQQQAYYIEDRDTSYSAKTRIEQLGDDLILFSVIKDANPKIFKATAISAGKIVFENNDYKNPFRVTYEFPEAGHYKRTITGYEQDSLMRYVFDFKRVETPL